MKAEVAFMLTCIFLHFASTNDSEHSKSHSSHQHFRRNSSSRRVESKLSNLKDRIFKGYDKEVKPDHQVKLELGMELLDLHLCPHKQVCTE